MFYDFTVQSRDQPFKYGLGLLTVGLRAQLCGGRKRKSLRRRSVLRQCCAWRGAECAVRNGVGQRVRNGVQKDGEHTGVNGPSTAFEHLVPGLREPISSLKVKWVSNPTSQWVVGWARGYSYYSRHISSSHPATSDRRGCSVHEVSVPGISPMIPYMINVIN